MQYLSKFYCPHYACSKDPFRLQSSIGFFLALLNYVVFFHFLCLEIPRYMRVNLIKSTVEDVIEELQSEGWEYIGKIESTR